MSGMLMAQSVVTVTGTNNGFAEGGVYTSPYQGTVNGVGTWMICDDYYDDSYLGESWKAYTTNVSSLSLTANPEQNTTVLYEGTYWDGTQLTQGEEYLAVAILAQETIANQANLAVAADYGFAIWDLTNGQNAITPNTTPNGTLRNTVPSSSTNDSCNGNAVVANGPNAGKNCSTDSNNVFSTLSSSDITTIIGYINSAVSTAVADAQQSSAVPSTYSNVTIYSFDSAFAPTCNNGTTACPTSPPQEFVVVSMAEPSMVLQMLLYTSCAGGLFLFFRRRRAFSKPQ
jgi:hypothetical protein